MLRSRLLSLYFVLLIKKNKYLVSYLAGLLVVGMAITASYLLLDRKIVLTRAAVQALELGYEQSVLAERINHLSYSHAIGAEGVFENGVNAALLSAVSKMHSNHLRLQQDPDLLEFLLAADDIYFAAENELDLKVRTFLGAARELAHHDPASLTQDGPLLRFLDTSKNQELHRLLGKTVDIYKAFAMGALVTANKTLWTLYGVIILVLLADGIMVSRKIVTSLSRKAEEYRELAYTDPLTGCCNRRSFIQAALEEQHLVTRQRSQSSVLMLDIDYFKKINDTWGHAAGDEVIRALVDTSLQRLRGNDVLGRLGGEEFAVLLRGTSEDNAFRVAESLRQALEDCRVEVGNGSDVVKFTVSIGIAGLSPNDDSPLDALEKADQALYRAKTSGRNRVCAYDELAQAVDKASGIPAAG